MKKIGWLGVLAIIAVIAIAAVMAGRMGDTSHAFARGRVVLDDKVAASAAGIQTLFVIMSGPDRPMPLGALKKTLGDGVKGGVIYEFVLTKDNMQMMMGQESVPERFKLKARLDRDGVAGPDQPGDLVGEVTNVALGSEDVEIRIDRVVAP